jgi:hypothetical protein
MPPDTSATTPVQLHECSYKQRFLKEHDRIKMPGFRRAAGPLFSGLDQRQFVRVL